MNVNLKASYRHDPLASIRLLADEEVQRENVAAAVAAIYREKKSSVVWLAAKIIAVFLLTFLFLNAWPAKADQFNINANATIFPDTLAVTASPGVSINWLGTGNTEIIQLFDHATAQYSLLSNLLPQTYTDQRGGARTFGEANDHDIMASITWTSVPPVGEDAISMGRWRAFSVSGMGDMTFSMDYRLAYTRAIDAQLLPGPSHYIETQGVIETNLLLFIPYVRGFEYDQRTIFMPDVIGSVTDSGSQSGTATITHHFDGPGTYWISSSSFSDVNVQAPEPSVLLLLSSPLLALVALKRKP